ncbi:urease accessory protein UreF [Kitasatospora aureofaciens]|uniref:Urease accessory protein UreF n=1 Tax=Kitasatospora aureofaciens TaxID=1894 RepID=A0A1E7N025_KITAU|nr:urease accessory UreF family protein [Kitasatospora aureofaciens]ARF77877.1 urease accessory protein [Kitasatospora aureofaciens]OEV34021.1 urease accessory protein [Kitasatospora aureofaciens]GGU73137.1 urease accessory protein UreF [Kitasatospora aureofaciens]
MSSPTGDGLDALLVSLQLTDSAFPSGFYTLSHGLEGYAQAKAVTPDTVPELLADLLRHSVGPSDATALALAHRAASEGDWELLVEIDQRLHATKLNRELRLAAARTGRQLLDIARESVGGEPLERYAELVADKRAPGCQAVAAGVAYASAAVPVEQAVASDLFAFCTSFVGAALRLRLTDHRRAQVVLRAAAPVIREVVAAALVRESADLGGCVPIADAMSGRHERAEARLFAS